MPLKQKYHLVNYMLTVAQSPKLKLVKKNWYKTWHLPYYQVESLQLSYRQLTDEPDRKLG